MANTAIKESKQWPRSVSIDLLQAWQKCKRKNDPEKMATELGYSRPVIDRALIYGYVSMPELTDKITNFFRDRLAKEKQDAASLSDIQKEVEGLKK